MTVRVDGREHPWRLGMTVADLLSCLEPSEAPVVVRVGSKTVSRKDFDVFKVPDGSEIRLIHMIAGG